MGLKHIGDALVFEAGLGEWYNQNTGSWNIEDDAVDRPPPPWHIELEQLVGLEEEGPLRLVIETSDMVWLIAADIGFIRRLAERVQKDGGCLLVVARKNVVSALGHVTPDKLFSSHETLADALAALRE